MNHKEKLVIFGTWQTASTPTMRVILKDEWEYANGRKQPAFAEAKEYAQLVLHDGYRLKTFSMGQELIDPTMKSETVRITEFDPNLKSGRLVYDRGTYFAYSEDGVFYFPDEWASDVPTVLEPLLEGSRRTVSVSAVERNSAARALCLEHYGLDCQVCGMNFGETFGELGEGFIHVHHVTPLSETRAERRVDPIEDLVPVCPNCHAMLHREVPPLSVNDLRSILNKPGIRS